MHYIIWTSECMVTTEKSVCGTDKAIWSLGIGNVLEEPRIESLANVEDDILMRDSSTTFVF